MQANCQKYIEFIATKMNSKTCRNLNIANDFKLFTQIVDNFERIDKLRSHYLKVLPQKDFPWSFSWQTQSRVGFCDLDAWRTPSNGCYIPFEFLHCCKQSDPSPESHGSNPRCWRWYDRSKNPGLPRKLIENVTGSIVFLITLGEKCTVLYHFQKGAMNIFH